MAFTDPQSVTISGTAISLPRVSSGDGKSKYLSSDGLVAFTASTAYGRRMRHVLRLDHSKIAADPLAPAMNAKVSSSVYLVIDEPDVGYDNTELMAIYAAFKTLITASSDALVSKVLGGES
ncbi:TPA_asm: coat protein [ssRNA phage Zoerhiza.4_20]|uniref:Coat protein n=2 Tax=Leviviricetes TaxID=2842243 RepID=A0A8S5L2R0_9VIRU|nr:coat protein [ssRNA phage Zoerhiza.4_20]QDH87339.1 MAG: hypothetical protein H4Rhizo45308_000002 [Leviviridae sp.]DAD51945.1 TPA_asm: coat protein [ssRNA phage Zoerhiza.4_20]